MRIPKKPPFWGDVLTQGDSSKLYEKLGRPEVTNLVRRINDKYLHWEKVQYQEMPEDVSPEELWAAVKLSRIHQLRELPLELYFSGQNIQFWTPPKHQQWLHYIDTQAAGTIGSDLASVPDDNDRYLFNSLMEEAIASSRLEGASSTREKAKKMLRTARKPRDVSEQMILNNYRAILEIRDLKSEKMTPTLLKHLHGILTENTMDKGSIGEFRQTNDVKVVETLTEEIMHHPPVWESVPSRLEALCQFANTDKGTFIHPVIKAIMLHFTIGFIHPFADGNGRTARAFFYWYMLKRGYWLFEYLPLSRILITGPAQYERAYLYAEHDGADATYFIHFHLKIIVKAIRDFHEYIEGQARSLREASKLVEKFPNLNHRQTALIQDCLKHPGRTYTIRQHIGLHRVAYATGRSDLLELTEAGLLIKEMHGQKAVFHSPENLLARIKSTPKARLLPGGEEPDRSQARAQREDSQEQQDLF